MSNPNIVVLHQLDDPGTWKWRVWLNGRQNGPDFDSREKAEEYAKEVSDRLSHQNSSYDQQ